MPLISIILTYRDREDFLPRTLCSLLRTTLRPLQVILVDNSSLDSSVEICHDFERKHHSSDFQVINISESCGGASQARNAGLAAATAPYVYFFDSDDVLSPGFLTDVARFIVENPQSAAVEGGEPHLIAAPTRMVFTDGSLKVRYTNVQNKITDQILTGMLSTQGMLLRRDFLNKIGGWNPSLPKWNDWELGVRVLLNNAKIQWLHKPYHLIYQHESSLTAMPRAEAFDAECLALHAVRKQVNGMKKAEEALAVRAFILSLNARRCGRKSEATALSEEFPLPSPMRQVLHIYARIYKKGIWRFARFFL